MFLVPGYFIPFNTYSTGCFFFRLENFFLDCLEKKKIEFEKIRNDKFQYILILYPLEILFFLHRIFNRCFDDYPLDSSVVLDNFLIKVSVVLSPVYYFKFSNRVFLLLLISGNLRTLTAAVGGIFRCCSGDTAEIG